MDSAPQLREEILRLVERYHAVAHAPKPFVPGESKVPYAGRVFDADELQRGVDSVLQFWLTAGPFANEFEREMRDYFGSSAAYLVNSGSSANLLMIATLLSPQIKDGLRRGDEVITPRSRFPPRSRRWCRTDLSPFSSIASPAATTSMSRRSRRPSGRGHARFSSRTPLAFRAISTSSPRSPRSTICGCSRTGATRSAQPGTASSSARSARCRPSHFIPRIT